MTVRAGREFLAIPGPTTVPDEVLRAMHRPAVDLYDGPLLALTDSVLIFFTTLSLFAFWLGFQTTRERRPWMWICYAAMGIATLAKGPVGFLVPLIVIALYLSLTKQWRPFWQEGRPLSGTALTILIALPWYAGMWWLHGSDYTDSAQANTVGRFLKPMEGHNFGFLFYVPVLLLGFFPWSGWLLFAWPQTYKSWRASRNTDATPDGPQGTTEGTADRAGLPVETPGLSTVTPAPSPSDALVDSTNADELTPRAALDLVYRLKELRAAAAAPGSRRTGRG